MVLCVAQAKLTLTAAAPISEDTLLYFGSLDIPIYEVFGQSECTGPHTVSSPGNWRIGYCGRPIRGTETKIAADTQELCYRGRHIFMGYMYVSCPGPCWLAFMMGEGVGERLRACVLTALYVCVLGLW